VDQDAGQPVPKSEDVPRVSPSAEPQSAPVETSVEPQPPTTDEDAPMRDLSAPVHHSTSEETVTASTSGIKRQSSHDGDGEEEDRAVKRVKEDHSVCPFPKSHDRS
jgi:hypothetical protein